MSDITTYRADVENVGEEAWLGQICWYSISETTVDHEHVLKLCRLHDLESHAPSAPRAPDVFRRVCKKAERKVAQTNGTKHVYSFKPITNDENEILVKLVRETVDTKNKAINWTRLANVKFVRDTKSLEVETLVHDNVGSTVLDDLVTNFQAENGKVNSAHLRRMIQSVLHRTSAIPVRESGGIYFIPQAHYDVAKRLSNVINGISSAHNLQLLPLVDLSDTRKMVKDAVESELSGDIDTILAQVRELVKAGQPISQSEFVRITSGLNGSGRKGNEYAQLLEVELDMFATRKTLIGEAIHALVSLVN